MRCSCCDKMMHEKEGSWNTDLGTFELCNNCLDIALEAAYSDGFQYDDGENIGIEVGEDSPDDNILSYSDLLSYRNIQSDEE